MRRWRKMTWAIAVWTVLNVLWLASYAGAVSKIAVTNEYEAAGRTIGAGIGTTFVIGIWFAGFVVLALIWFMSRPKNNVVVYGPQGQQVTVSESEAKSRVETKGWSYTPTARA